MFINDIDADVVARNVILLLTALCFDQATAVEAMIHIWYSTLLPRRIYNCLRQKLLPMLNDVCTDIKGKHPKKVVAKTWRFDSRELRVSLKVHQWIDLPSYLKVPAGLSPASAHDIRTSITMGPERKDQRERVLYPQPPGWRVSRMRFRRDGILLPFGASRREFDTLNP